MYFKHWLILLGLFWLNPALAAAPALVYSTYLGASDSENGFGVVVDHSGNAYVVGTTASTNFPGAPVQPQSRRQGFVTKFDPTGTRILYTALLPGTVPLTIAVAEDGSAYVAGQATDGFAATAGAYQRSSAGKGDAFLLKLNPAGSAVVYATYLGGREEDVGKQLVIDAVGNAYLTGYTFSADFPTLNAWQPAAGGNGDAFLAKLNPDGSALLFSTFLGGDAPDYSMALARDSTGNIFIGGRTDSTNFPLQQPFSGQRNGGVDAFLARFNNAGQLTAATYLGGSGAEFGTALAVDPQGNVWFLGATSSTNFPLRDPWQAAFGGGGYDSFLVKMTPALDQLLYGTFLGGSLSEIGVFRMGESQTPVDLGGLAIDQAGNVYAASSTDSGDFPFVNPLKAGKPAYDADGFVAKFSPNGALTWATPLGGEAVDQVAGLALDGTGSVYLAGSTGWNLEFPNFPISPGAFQSGLGGPFGVYYIAQDAFVARLQETDQPGANDLFAGRFLLTGNRLTTWGDNRGFGTEPGEPAHAGTAGGHSAWWAWTAPADGKLTVTTEGSGFDTVLSVYEGSSVGSLSLLAGNDDASGETKTSAIKIPVQTGRGYLIAVDGAAGATGLIVLNLSFGSVLNDDLADATILTGTEALVTGGNVGATYEPGERNSVGLTGGNSVWWSWTAPASGPVTITTEGSDFSNGMAVFTGNEISNLTRVATETDRLTFKAVAGTTYRIVVDGFLGTAGQIRLSLAPGHPPLNDDFSSRIFLSGLLVRTNGSNFDATPEPGDPDLAALYQILSPRKRTVWWAWTAPTNGTVLISTTGSDRDTRLAVFTGESLNQLTPVTGNDNARDGVFTSRVLITNIQANVTYQIFVDIVEWERPGPLQLNISIIKPPLILDPKLLPDGRLAFRVQGSLERQYTIESSSTPADLNSWVPLLTSAVNQEGQIDFVEPAGAGFQRRFFRVAEVPED